MAGAVDTVAVSNFLEVSSNFLSDVERVFALGISKDFVCEMSALARFVEEDRPIENLP